MKEFILAGLFLIGSASGVEDGLKTGQIAPDFKLMDQDSTYHNLSDYKGQRVVVYFYPKDDTPGCTKEACSIRDDYSLFETDSIKVFGISYDGPESHKKFATKYNLPFTLLSDEKKTTAKAYESGGLFFPKRKTFLVDENGVLVKIYENVDVTTHGQQILADFKTLSNPGK